MIPQTRFRGEQLIFLCDLLRELVTRAMKVKYKRSVFGVAWSLLTPLSQLLVYYFVFNLVLPLDIPNYASFVFIGTLVWSWFQASLLEAASAITGSRELIRRPGFPAVILPIVPVVTNFLHFLFALPVLVVVLVVAGTELRPMMLSLALVMLCQFVFTLSLAYLIATVNVLFRDAQHLLGVLLQLLFFMTPVFYDTRAIPAPYQLIYEINPMAQLVDLYRVVLIQGMPPDWLALLVVAVFACGLLGVGLRFFGQMNDRFVEEL